MMNDHIAQFDDVSHRYDNYLAIDQLNFKLPTKGIVGLLGLNGAGKTTTMNLLCGIMSPSEGRILIGDQSLKTYPKHCKRLIGYAPDRPPLYPESTVEEYLTYTAALRNIPRVKRKTAIDQTLEACSITDHANKLCGQLSHGYRQRLNLAQAIVHTPPIIVLDEPTSGLDPEQIGAMRRLIQQLSQSSCVLISTHLLFEAQQLCNRVLIIYTGRIADDCQLDQQESTACRLRLHFKPSTEASAQALIDTVSRCPVLTGVQAIGNHELSVTLVDEDDQRSAESIRRDMLSYLIDKNLTPLEMRNDRPDLEKRFLATIHAHQGQVTDQPELPSNELVSDHDPADAETKSEVAEQATDADPSNPPS